jgi:hypothetical protein
VTASCTGNEAAVESTSTVVTTPAPTTSTSTTTTTTTQAPSLDELLRSRLAGDDFSATVAAAAATTQPIGTITATGTGSINGPDSELRLNSDLTGLLGTFMDGKGRVIGKRGLSEISQHTIVIDGVQYRQDNGDKWRISEDADPDSALGHVVAMLRAVPMFDEGDSETIDGRVLTVMHPMEVVEYDPRFFDFDPEGVQTFNADTSVLVDAEGLPVQVRVTVQAEIKSSGIRCSGSPLEGWSDCGPAATILPTDLELTFDLSGVGSTVPVEPPPRHWVTLSSLGFWSDADTALLFDMEVPADWIVAEVDTYYIGFDAPGAHVQVALDFLEERVPVEDTLGYALSVIGIEPDAVVEPEYSVFPSQLAKQEVADLGYEMLYNEVELGQLLLTVFWQGPLDALVLQQADLEEVLATITWHSVGQGFMPGETLGDETLQSDALGSLLTTASIVSDCDEPIALWTDLVSGGFDRWTEDWYFDSCGTIEIFDVTFAASPQGGINILFTADSRQPGE